MARLLTYYNLLLATLVVIGLVSLPPGTNVPGFVFLALCVGIFASFFALSVAAKTKLREALLRALVWAFVTIMIGGWSAMAIHGIGPCGFTL
ncbi:MAG TPA: hypothetical protein VG146_07090 [Verrucomicrobiae bacterium]|nr:hypothetical protein [Verrucomicrobiae bacterium]